MPTLTGLCKSVHHCISVHKSVNIQHSGRHQSVAIKSISGYKVISTHRAAKIGLQNHSQKQKTLTIYGVNRIISHEQECNELWYSYISYLQVFVNCVAIQPHAQYKMNRIALHLELIPIPDIKMVCHHGTCLGAHCKFLQLELGKK